MAKTARFKEAFRRLSPYLKRYRRTAIFMVLVGAIAASGQRLTLIFLKPLVTLLFPERAADAPAATELSLLDQFSQNWIDPAIAGVTVFGLGPEASAVTLLVGFMVVAAVVFALLQFWFLRMSRMIGIWMIVDLRQDLAQHLLRMGMRYHAGRRLGDVVSRMTADVSTSLRLLNILVEELIQGPFNILASLFLAYAAAPRATLGMLIFVPLLAWPIFKIGPRVRRRSARSQEKLGDTTQSLMQMLSGIRVVKAFRLEDREAEEFKKTNDEFVHQTDRMVKAQATSQGFTAFLAQAGTGILIGVLVLIQVSGYRIFTDAGNMTLFFLGIGTMFAHVKRLSKALSNIFVSMGATERIFEVFDIPAETTDEKLGVDFDGFDAEIEFRNVGFDYEMGEGPALEELNFKVKRGERIALVGPSGSGKSTLLDLIARFYKPSSGEILIDGQNLNDLRRSDWLDRLAIVSQTPFLFQSTLGENVRLGKRGSSDEEVITALQAAQLGDFLRDVKGGLDAEVGESGTRLSGGQAQRVTIARAMLRNADLLLLDEATSALDTHSERRVQEALHRLLTGRTAFVIAHRLSTIQDCDRILVLDGGRIVEEGSHDALLAAEGHYAKMWQLQHQAG